MSATEDRAQSVRTYKLPLNLCVCGHCFTISFLDGRWSSWTEWTICSKTCGRGVQNRSRSCSEPAPSHGGLQCDDQRNQVRSCSPDACSVDGGWSTWSCWSSCSVTCGVGERNRNRSCSNPRPTGGGLRCQGDETETSECEASFHCGRGRISLF